MKPLDLSWGSPKFLAPYWENIDLSIPSNLPTAYQPGTIASLDKAIRDIHIQEQNVAVDGKYIVIGNGASQILQAVFASIETPVYADAPYFSRFPILAEQAGVGWGCHKNNYKIVTTPNNPTGEIFEKVKKSKTILDLSYNWQTYTPSSPIRYDHPISVFSLAKATGHASTRIGWAILEDKKLADKVEAYIETSTCGVSIEAQHKAVAVLKTQLNRKKTVFDYGKKELHRRWNDLVLRKGAPFRIANDYGMFLWCVDSGYLFEKIKVNFLPGTQFGSDFYLGYHQRINLGCSNEEYDEFLKRLKPL